MKVGVISDTHDNVEKITEAVRILNNNAVEFVFHCGDFVAPFSLEPLKDLKCEWLGVFGNNDGEKEGLLEKSGNRIKTAPFFIEMDSRKIGLIHKNAELDADIVLFGHSHKYQEKREGNKLILNPGEVCGWLFGRSSLVILDLKSLTHQVLYF